MELLSSNTRLTLVFLAMPIVGLADKQPGIINQRGIAEIALVSRKYDLSFSNNPRLFLQVADSSHVARAKKLFFSIPLAELSCLG